MSGPQHPLSASVVVITAGRRQCLPPCIESLRQQTYRPIEIVVIVGPSQDGTTGYASTLTNAKVFEVDQLNVAHARNEGVRRAGGDIIAFIDDDAVAHPHWLEDLVGVFEREGPSCGCVAGYVVNENGKDRPVQALNNTINEFGDANEVRLIPTGQDDPFAPVFNYFMGANMAFRREAILEVGGFDETYTYLYEDADLCVAVQRAGYRLVRHTRALVHHFPALSHNRRGRFHLNYFAIARHQLYFSLKYSKRTVLSCLWGVVKTKEDWLRDFAREVRSFRMTPRAALRYTAMAVRGLASGLKHGRHYRRHGRETVLTPDLPRPTYLPIEKKPVPAAGETRRHQLRVALVCGEFGGPVFGGVGGYTQHLAEALAAFGHDVTVLRSGPRNCRIRPDGYEIINVPPPDDPAVYRTRFQLQLQRLASDRDFDIVEAPLWNGEGAAIGVASRWPLVIRLQTPFELTRQISGLDLEPAILNMIAAEQLQLAYAAGIIGISRAVVNTVEEAYSIPLEAHGRRLTVIPLGIPGAAHLMRRPVEAPSHGGTRYLFVGRLEARKGVLELGRAFARVAERDSSASLWIAGADNSMYDGFQARTGGDYHQALRTLWSEEVASRVHFFGKVSDEEKNDLFAQCDVLVAPSRYESFGLIFLEAMRYGKPVIGTSVGGVPEVVSDGCTGLLVPPETPDQLADAMLRMGANPDLRQALGTNGLKRFEESFSLYSLARETENFYRQVLKDWHGRSYQATHLETSTAIVPYRPAFGRIAA